MATKIKAKTKTTASKKPVKALKTNKKPVAKAKKPVAVKKPVKTVKKPMAKTVAKPKAKVVAKKDIKTTAKKPVAAVKTPIKAVKTPAPTVKTTAVAVVKAPKITKSRKKPTKEDRKMARTLVKIANAGKTAVANVGVQSAQSAAMAAMRATIAMNAANANHTPAPQPVRAPANANQPSKDAAKNDKPAFKPGDVVVYPAHGVGKVAAVEAHTVGDQEIKLFRITFDHERMTLKVPVARATGSGLRQLSSKETMKNVFETMKGRPRVRRVMWSRRAQEYEQKINSGDPVAIAEVLRDLRRNAESGDQSYSERQIFNNALERLAREVAAIDKIDQEKAVAKLSDLLLRKAAASATPVFEPANDEEVDAA